MPRHRVIAGPSRFEPPPIKGSRFLASVFPVGSEAEASQATAALRAEFPNATHHCWAWVLQDGRHRSSDDGEPGGSAGRPILAQIQGHGLSDALVVVSRWFGGTKLGVGGLIRAYGGTAGMALDRAEVSEVEETTPLTVRHAYDDTAAVQQVIASEGLTVLDTRWTDTVEVTLAVPVDALERVTAQLRDRTGGRARLVGDDSSEA